MPSTEVGGGGGGGSGGGGPTGSPSLQLDFDRLQIHGLATATAEASPAKTVATLVEGDVVSVKYRGKEWRRATVVGVREEGSFDVAFDNGEHENGVPPSMLRLRDSPRHIKSTSPVRPACQLSSPLALGVPVMRVCADFVDNCGCCRRLISRWTLRLHLLLVGPNGSMCKR